jgi:hypothetical protein
MLWHERSVMLCCGMSGLWRRVVASAVCVAVVSNTRTHLATQLWHGTDWLCAIGKPYQSVIGNTGTAHQPATPVFNGSQNTNWTRAGKLKNCSSIPGESKKCLCSTKHPEQLWGPQNLLFNGVSGSCWAMMLTTHIHLVMRPRMRGAIP